MRTGHSSSLASLIACFVVLAVGTPACIFDADSCGNNVLSELPSPDASRRAVLFVRNCGATTRFSTQLALISSGRSLPNEGGNVLVAETGYEPTGVDDSGRPAVAVQWVSADELRVTYAEGIRVFRKELELAGVGISYVTFNP